MFNGTQLDLKSQLDTVRCHKQYCRIHIIPPSDLFPRVCVNPFSDRSAVKGAEELILGSGHLRQALITMATVTWTDSSP